MKGFIKEDLGTTLLVINILKFHRKKNFFFFEFLKRRSLFWGAGAEGGRGRGCLTNRFNHRYLGEVHSSKHICLQKIYMKLIACSLQIIETNKISKNWKLLTKDN